MKRLLVTLVLLALPCSAWSAAFTSKAAGNWSASGQTTWNEAGVPGDGDTVTIAHAVVVDTSTVIGASGATGTAAITITGGSLTVSAPLEVKGDIIHRKGATVYGTPGGGIQFTPPSGSTYVWKTDSTGSGYPIINLAGTSENRFVVTTTQGGGACGRDRDHHWRGAD